MKQMISFWSGSIDMIVHLAGQIDYTVTPTNSEDTSSVAELWPFRAPPLLIWEGELSNKGLKLQIKDCFWWILVVFGCNTKVYRYQNVGMLSSVWYCKTRCFLISHCLSIVLVWELEFVGHLEFIHVTTSAHIPASSTNTHHSTSPYPLTLNPLTLTL